MRKILDKSSLGGILLLKCHQKESLRNCHSQASQILQKNTINIPWSECVCSPQIHMLKPKPIKMTAVEVEP